MSKKESDCKGCPLNPDNLCVFSIIKGILEKCPCKKCIVKVMCNEVCEDYMILSQKVAQLLKERRGI
jgi:hypothetical protein